MLRLLLTLVWLCEVSVSDICHNHSGDRLEVIPDYLPRPKDSWVAVGNYSATLRLTIHRSLTEIHRNLKDLKDLTLTVLRPIEEGEQLVTDAIRHVINDSVVDWFFPRMDLLRHYGQYVVRYRSGNQSELITCLSVDVRYPPPALGEPTCVFLLSVLVDESYTGPVINCSINALPLLGQITTSKVLYYNVSQLPHGPRDQTAELMDRVGYDGIPFPADEFGRHETHLANYALLPVPVPRPSTDWYSVFVFANNSLGTNTSHEIRFKLIHITELAAPVQVELRQATSSELTVAVSLVAPRYSLPLQLSLYADYCFNHTLLLRNISGTPVVNSMEMKSIQEVLTLKELPPGRTVQLHVYVNPVASTVLSDAYVTEFNTSQPPLIDVPFELNVSESLIGRLLVTWKIHPCEDVEAFYVRLQCDDFATREQVARATRISFTQLPANRRCVIQVQTLHVASTPSDWSEPLVHTTRAQKLSQPPSDVHIVSLSSDSVSVAWTPLRNPSDDVTCYNVTLVVPRHTSYDTELRVTAARAVMSLPLPATRYSLRVQQCGRLGCSRSQSISFTSNITAASAVRDLDVTKHDADVHVKWREPDEKNAQHIVYELRYKASGAWTSVNTTNTSITLSSACSGASSVDLELRAVGSSSDYTQQVKGAAQTHHVTCNKTTLIVAIVIPLVLIIIGIVGAVFIHKKRRKALNSSIRQSIQVPDEFPMLSAESPPTTEGSLPGSMYINGRADANFNLPEVAVRADSPCAERLLPTQEEDVGEDVESADERVVEEAPAQFSDLSESAIQAFVQQQQEGTVSYHSDCQAQTSNTAVG